MPWGVPVTFPEPVAVSTADALGTARLRTKHLYLNMKGQGGSFTVPPGCTWVIEHMLIHLLCGASEGDRYPKLEIQRDDRLIYRMYSGCITKNDMLDILLGSYDGYSEGTSYAGINQYVMTRPLWRGPYLSGDVIAVDVDNIFPADYLNVDLIVDEVTG